MITIPQSVYTDFTLNAVDNMETYEAMEQRGETYQNQLYLIGGSPRGKAVVFGDSLFDGGDDYNFAEYLKKQEIYESVTDYAKGGSGFATTYPGIENFSLYALLQRQDVQASVRAADVIYLSLGGNDVFSCVVPDATPDPLVAEKATACFTTIHTLNPDILIYYIPPPTAAHTWKMILSLSVTSEASTPDIIAALYLAYSIQAIIAAAPCNIKIANYLVGVFNDTPDGIHPTATSAINGFDYIIRSANYSIPKVQEIILRTQDNATFYADDLSAAKAIIQGNLLSDNAHCIMITTDDVNFLTINEAPTCIYSSYYPYSFVLTAPAVIDTDTFIMSIALLFDINGDFDSIIGTIPLTTP